ncbi:uncharacterized protein BO80DRAFT_378624 [Aspergillus ibericus CBS 121593]|uniref:Transcription factor hoxa13 n=1 Tax=Aspergillus ibericus CBS 121593 TaxID=1448316 RepID=A0A395H599_9EURO|nr:transcription factor hoxa13 [Aspergillus ibericus CBS 121593]RAL02305.1 transcription factor hoxa13 [Aspergillus ibericus CBS 121593]
MMAIPDNSNIPEGGDRVAGSRNSGLKSSRRSTLRWTVGLIVRLCIWYALITPFLRCPSQLSDLTDSSPRVCRPYLVARSYIEPHVTPYYNAYGAPYVEAARPYVLVLNEKVYAPTSRVVKHGYEKYGAPAMDKAHLYGQQQWEINVVPHLQSATDRVNDLYQSQIQPHVERVEASLSPSFQKVNGAVKSAYGDYLLPFGAKYRPFIGKTYTSGQEMLTTTVLPYAQNTWSTAIYFIHSSLWPRVTGLYWENVEPQLVKIGERLASYREEKRLRQAVEEVETCVSEQPSSSITAPKVTEAKDLTSSSKTEEITMQQTLSPTEQAAKARDSVESDLRTWQQKFAVAADKGLEDLEERLQEVVDMFMTSGARTHGESLTTALEAVVDNELIALKHHINNLAESLPTEDAPREEEAAKDELLGNVKEAAVSIRDRAHALREWRGSFERELTYRVSRAVNSTLDVLDSVRDLGLQEVGMRWAWMDGITYKDWARYHALKAQFEDWKDEFLDFGLQHERLEEARAVADEILSYGMDIAEAAAKELARLRNVGNWKIAAREVSDNFDTRSDDPPPRPKPIPAPENTVDEDAATEGVADTELPDETTFEFDATSQTESGEEGGDDESMAADEEHTSAQPIGETSSGYTSSTPPDDSENDMAAEQNADETSDLKKAPWGVAAADVPDQSMPTTQQTPIHVSSAREKPGVSGHDLSSEQEAVANLISGLLVGKDAAYAEDIMNKLHSIYGTPRPTSEPSVTSYGVLEHDGVDADAPDAPIPVLEDQSSPSLHDTDVDDASGTASDVFSIADDNEQPSSSEDIEVEVEVEIDSTVDTAESHSAILDATASSLVSEATETILPELTQSVEDDAEEEL